MGAKEFSLAASDRLMNFLNEHKDLPIVAHYAKHDREQCLKPAFKKVGNNKLLAEDKRWMCTYEMSFKVPCLPLRTLDDVLEHFNYERRNVEELHSAINDCRLTAKIFMKLVEVPDLKKNPTLGFCHE